MGTALHIRSEEPERTEYVAISFELCYIIPIPCIGLNLILDNTINHFFVFRLAITQVFWTVLAQQILICFFGHEPFYFTTKKYKTINGLVWFDSTFQLSSKMIKSDCFLNINLEAFKFEFLDYFLKVWSFHVLKKYTSITLDEKLQGDSSCWILRELV